MGYVGFGLTFAAQADPAAAVPETGDYLEPARLTATISSPEERGSKELFRFRREATREGATVRVLREYSRPDGTLVARERVVYQAGKLISFQLEEPLSGAHGSVLVQTDPDRPDRRNLNFDYTSETGSRKSDVENLEPDTLVNDTVGPFIAGHWAMLMKGESAKARFVAVARAETVGFKFLKESETTWRGRPVAIIRMQPTSWIIAQIVKPLRFVVEKESKHRVLQYTGRTTPRVLRGKRWEDVDAVTVFDWP